MDIGLSYLTRWFPLVEKAIDGHPTFLLHNGKVDDRALRKTRMNIDDIMVAARKQHGLERLGQVKHAVLETDSGITVIPKPETQ